MRSGPKVRQFSPDCWTDQKRLRDDANPRDENENSLPFEMVDPIFGGGGSLSVLLHDRGPVQGAEELSRIETTRALAGFLKHFDLFPKAQSGKTRGYAIRRDWLSIWGARYGRS
jgi:hypothetical protein